MNMETEKISVPRFLSLFKTFSPSERVQIAKEIDEQTFRERWKLLDAELPNVDMTDDEIMREVQAVRYDKESR